MQFVLLIILFSYEKDTSCLRHTAGGDQDGSFGKGVPKEQ